MSQFDNKEQSSGEYLLKTQKKKKKNLESVTDQCGKMKGNSQTRQKYEDEIIYKLLYPRDPPYI